MDACEYAQLEDGLDYLYAFFDEDLEERVRAGRELLPEGMEVILGDHTVEDFVWLWIKEPGPRGFRQYLRDGGYDGAEVSEAFLFARTEWGMNTPPHVEWLREDGVEVPEFP